MELGAKIRAARLELGLSQRQLCGEVITRNMLSQIENGSAKPSMQTLGYLAQGLGKSVSYFLEEQAVVSPNMEVMEQARKAWREGDGAAVVAALEDFREPDPVFREEMGLLRCLGWLDMAEKALEQGRQPYALALLEKAGGAQSLYITPALHRRRLLLLGRAGQKVGHLLRDEDEALLLRAAEALEDEPRRCVALLEAALQRDTPRWQLLYARASLALGEYAQAAACFQNAEAVYPGQAWAGLEVCYRELGDFQRAYEYACKQRG